MVCCFDIMYLFIIYTIQFNYFSLLIFILNSNFCITTTLSITTTKTKGTGVKSSKRRKRNSNNNSESSNSKSSNNNNSNNSSNNNSSNNSKSSRRKSSTNSSQSDDGSKILQVDVKKVASYFKSLSRAEKLFLSTGLESVEDVIADNAYNLPAGHFGLFGLIDPCDAYIKTIFTPAELQHLMEYVPAPPVYDAYFLTAIASFEKCKFNLSSL